MLIIGCDTDVSEKLFRREFDMLNTARGETWYDCVLLPPENNWDFTLLINQLQAIGGNAFVD